MPIHMRNYQSPKVFVVPPSKWMENKVCIQKKGFVDLLGKSVLDLANVDSRDQRMARVDEVSKCKIPLLFNSTS